MHRDLRARIRIWCFRNFYAVSIGVLVASTGTIAATAGAADLLDVPALDGIDPGVPRVGRDADPVILKGAELPELVGVDLQAIAVAKWNPESSAFESIPFQVDPRVLNTFNKGTPVEFTQDIHDVLGLDDGALDPGDEVVFLYGDAGPSAPPDAAWPAGDGSVRYEVKLDDPLDPEAAPRYAYVFADVTLSAPPSYVHWNVERTAVVETDLFALDFADRWLLTGYYVRPPCGDGSDRIDRLKARAGITVQQGESENDWNISAVFMGGRVGPIRAIRYVRGAASGYNTIHHDVVYRDFWEREIALRVHPIANVWFYFDWKPELGLEMIVPGESPVALDGEPDRGLPDTLPPWQVVRGPGGGMTWLIDVPETPLIGEASAYYLDDADFDDAPSSPFPYDDEDDAAWGTHGVHLATLTGSEVEAVFTRGAFYPMCAGQGDAETAETLRRRWTEPILRHPTPQWREIGEIADLRVDRLVGDVVLDWNPVVGAAGYRALRSDDPGVPPELWEVFAEVGEPPAIDSGAVNRESPAFYRVEVVAP